MTHTNETSKFPVSVLIFCFSEHNSYLMALIIKNKCWLNLRVALHVRRPGGGAYVIKSFALPLNSEWLKQSHLIKL